jgi:hypothetical protein
METKQQHKLSDWEIQKIAMERYGVPVLLMDPMQALWLAEFIWNDMGILAYNEIRGRREGKGWGTMFPAEGSSLYVAVLAALKDGGQND